MSLTHRQREMLFLAGTVRIPSPPPAVGDVAIVDEPDAAEDPVGLVLRVTHKLSSRLYLERLVRLADVRAIHAAWPAPKGKEPLATEAPGYKTGAALERLARKFLKDYPKRRFWLREAVLYVDELAPVVLRVEAALTAAESVEYYPPIVGDGSSHAARYFARFSVDCRDDEKRDCHIPPGPNAP